LKAVAIFVTMAMRICLLIFFWFSGLFASQAQTVLVLDSATSNPLEHATITGSSTSAFAITNSKGQADVQAFVGSAIMEFRMLGYKTFRCSFTDIVQQGFRVKLVVSGIGLDELVISATRWNTSRGNTPHQVQSISPQQVQLAQPQTTADLLTLSGSVYLQKSQQAGGSPMIRGFAANRLLYAVDGVRMNTAIFRSGNLQNVISIDPFSIEKTEVLLGPGSVLYGSDAIGGVMSFRTLSPVFSVNDSLLVTGKASARFASANNEYTGHTHVSIGGKKLASLISYSHFDYGELRMGANGPDDYLNTFYVVNNDNVDNIVLNDDPLLQRKTDYYQDNIAWRLRWIPNHKSSFDAGVLYSATGNYNRYDRLIRTNDSGSPSSAEWYYGPQTWLMTRIAFHQIGDGTKYDEMTLQAAWQRFGESRNDRSFGKSTLRNRKEQVDAFSFNADFRKRFSKSIEVHYGVELLANQVRSSGMDRDLLTGVAQIGPSRYPNALWSSYAGYMTLELPLGIRSRITAGGRYNGFRLQADFDTTFYPFPFTEMNLNNSALTGSLGWVYDLHDEWKLNVVGATGFRAPNVDDVGKVFDSEPGSVVVPNPELDPEYALNLEAGIIGAVREKLHIDFNVYHTWLNNAMVRRDFNLNGLDSIEYDGQTSQVQAIQNAAIARVYGAYFGITYAFNSYWNVRLTINYQNGEEELDDGTISPLRHAAPMFGSTRITYRKNRFSAEASIESTAGVAANDMPFEYVSSPHLFALNGDGKPYAPSWTIANLKAKYTFRNRYTIAAGIDNVADVRYKTFGSGLVASGRSLHVGLHLAF
jgi:hemoglobin/transferrin/lactoferrin receptor protein